MYILFYHELKFYISKRYCKQYIETKPETQLFNIAAMLMQAIHNVFVHFKLQ
jgi:hypothetical protein